MPLEVTAAAEEVTVSVQLLNFVVGELTYQFLAHAIDINRSNLIDNLVTKNVLSPEQRERIKKQKKTDGKADILLKLLREKSAAEFDGFLAALSETGQQSVADVVLQVLHTAGLTGQNPLHQLTDGMCVGPYACYTS